MANIHLWPTLIRLNHGFINNIKLFYVYAEGKEIIIVTNEDDVFKYSFRNENNEEKFQEPTKIEALCGKGVIDIMSGKYNDPHVVALTKDGKVYAWGNNKKGQCGIGSNSQIVTEPTLVPLEEPIQQLACGGFYTLALSRVGNIYSWGTNGCGVCGSAIESYSTPVKVPNLNNMISIACGLSHALALNTNGQVYTWGNNPWVQNTANDDVLAPALIETLNSVRIKRIACGPFHSLLLAYDGTIYSFGNNASGQLGDGTFDHKSTPTKINDCDSIKFIDVAATHHKHISVAVSEDGKCFVWGHLNTTNVKEPSETNFTSLDDVFGAFSYGKAMWKSARVRHNKGSLNNKQILENIRKSFNNKENYDLKIKVCGEYIYCHKFYLKIQCQHFNTMFNEMWDKDGKNEIQLNGYSYKVYYAFIEFLYKNEVNVDADDALDLLDLANSYFENELKQRCVEIIKESVSVENVASIFSAAVKFNADELRNFCVQFAHNKMKTILNTEAFDKMECNLIKDFLRGIFGCN